MATTELLDLDAVTAALPGGYRARAFRDEDRERAVEIQNGELPEPEQQSADDWRAWERTAPDDTLVRFLVQAPDGDFAAMLNVSNGGPFRAPDGSARGNVGVTRPHRGKGIGSTLLPALEAHARRLGAPKIHSSVSERDAEALPWATKRGYREIGRRIRSAIDLATFDPARWEERRRKPIEGGIRLATLGELRAGKDDAAFEALLRDVYDAEGDAWEDVPLATPMPHWPYAMLRKLLLEGPGSALELDILALDGDRVVGMTTSHRQQDGRRGGTAFTGTRRAYRGRGIAFALKVEALTRAKASGIRWMLTTNDEPNKPMRGINHALGYVPLPATVQLEKTL